MSVEKLTDQQFLNLLDLVSGDEYTSPEIAEAFNLSLADIYSVVAGEVRYQAGYPYPWATVGGIPSSTPRNSKRRYADHVAMHAMRNKGLTLKAIATQFELSVTSVAASLKTRPYRDADWMVAAEQMRKKFGKNTQR